MTNITQRDLEAAFLDQTVAGMFGSTPYAYVVVGNDDGTYRLGVAVANEDGYNLISGKNFDSQSEAGEWAADLNRHIGLTDSEVASIIISTMGGMRHTRWPQ